MQKGTASGEEASGAVREGIPPHGGRAFKELRQHHGASAGTGRESAHSLQVARPAGPGCELRQVTATGLPRIPLRKEVSQLKRRLADKALEVDFFKGALQKVEARRQRTGSSGETASTTKSGK